MARNTAGSTSKDCLGASIISYDYNLIGNTTSCLIDVSQAGHDQLNVDPKLGVFDPSLGIVPLLETSPAIDAGNPADPGSGGNACVLIDQRGVTRPVDGPDPDTVATCDIGAVEYMPAGEAENITYSMGSQQTAAPNTQFGVRMQVIVTDNLGTPRSNAPVIFTAPDSGPSGVFVDSNSNMTTVLTDVSGIATAPDFVANGNMGSYLVIASIETLTETVAFSISNAHWYVATDGNNSNDCISAATPCATIQAVLSKPAFSAGNTVLVKQGLYNTLDNIDINKDVNIKAGWDASYTSQTGTSVIEDHIGINSGTSVLIEDVTIRNVFNSAGIENSGTLLVKNSSVIKNPQGIYNKGSLTLVNSTISENGKVGTRPLSGGGILNWTQPASVFLLNSTVANNAADAGGGIGNSSFNAGIVTLQNSIVAGNTGDPGLGVDCQGGESSGITNHGLFVSMGNNIIGDIGTYNGTEYPCRAVWQSTDIVGDHAKPVKVNLEALANAGNDRWVQRTQIWQPGDRCSSKWFLSGN